MRPRVALVTWNYDRVQGVGRCVVELTSRLAGRYEITVFARHVAAAAPAGVTVVPVPLRIRPRHLEEWEFYFRAGAALRRGRFDLVHLHFPAWFTAPLFTCHAVSPAALRALARFPSEAREPGAWGRFLRFHLQDPLYALNLRDPRTRVATVSERARRDVIVHYGRGPADVVVIPNGVDHRRFAVAGLAAERAVVRHELGLGADRFVLLLVGNNLRWKGGRHALRLLERLPADVALVVVGDNSRRSLPELEPLAARLEDQGRLRFTGQREHVERYYAAADALLFPSLYESFGLVLLEALAAGLPVVTARTVALADELIRDGENGFIVDHPWDVAGMALRIERLMRDPGLRDRMGRGARAAAEPFTWDRHVALTDALYRDTLGRSAAASEA